MLRFIDLGNQINEDSKAFAFYNTVTDHFVDIGPNHVWESQAGFISDYRFYEENIRHLARFLSVIPEEWKNA